MTPEALAALHAAAFSEDRPWSAQELADLLASPLVFAVTEPQGFALGRAIAGEAELLTIAVHPEARRHGLGRRLLDGFHATAQARAADMAFLEVAADNAPALGLYRTAGYSDMGRRKGYYARAHGAAVDALTLRRPLATEAPAPK